MPATRAPRLTHDMPDPDYRAIPAAHYSGLKTILDCPARYIYERDHRTHKDAFDLGHVVHGMLLGVGDPVERLDFPDRRTKAYKDAAQAARDAGSIPLLAATYDSAVRCANAVKKHSLAGPILTRPGHSEVTLEWSTRGVPCKARVDRITITPDGTHWLVDLKTRGRSVDPRRFGYVAADYGYYIQAGLYLDGYVAATGVDPDDVRWLNVSVETDPPYLPAVTVFDETALDIGRAHYHDAIDIWQRCYETDEWPGYTDTEAAVVSLPYYLTHAQETADV